MAYKQVVIDFPEIERWRYGSASIDLALMRAAVALDSEAES